MGCWRLVGYTHRSLISGFAPIKFTRTPLSYVRIGLSSSFAFDCCVSNVSVSSLRLLQAFPFSVALLNIPRVENQFNLHERSPPTLGSLPRSSFRFSHPRSVSAARVIAFNAISCRSKSNRGRRDPDGERGTAFEQANCRAGFVYNVINSRISQCSLELVVLNGRRNQLKKILSFRVGKYILMAIRFSTVAYYTAEFLSLFLWNSWR